MGQTNADRGRYWKANLKCVAVLLGIWFFVSFGCGILFREWLDERFSIGGAPFGFWMAQQGSIICFIILLVVYAKLMDRLDAQHQHGGKGDR